MLHVAAGVINLPPAAVLWSGGQTGWAAFLVVVAAWYVPCYLVNGQKFIQEFLIEQNINRFWAGTRRTRRSGG